MPRSLAAAFLVGSLLVGSLAAKGRFQQSSQRTFSPLLSLPHSLDGQVAEFKYPRGQESFVRGAVAIANQVDVTLRPQRLELALALLQFVQQFNQLVPAEFAPWNGWHGCGGLQNRKSMI